MFFKLLAIIVAIGLTACGLLSMRQARLQAAHELADAQLRIWRHDERLLRLHADIARLVAPDRVRSMVSDSNGLADLIDAGDAGWVSFPDDAPQGDWTGLGPEIRP